MAIVHAPTIRETRAVMDGVELSILNQGVLGEYPDSEAPGEIGNFAVAGYRTTYGRPMWTVAELQPGDPSIVETKFSAARSIIAFNSFDYEQPRSDGPPAEMGG